MSAPIPIKTPAAPAVTAVPVATTVATTKTWLQNHERLILVVLVLSFLVFGVSKYFDHEATKDQAAASLAQQTLAAAIENSKALAAQVAGQTAQYRALVIQLTQQNAQLTQQVNTRTVVLQQQVATDKTLPLPLLGNRWATLIQAAPGDLTATTAGVSVTPQAALATVTQLESVPVLTKNLADTQTENTNLNAELTSSDDLTTGLKSQVTALNTQLGDQTKSCKAEVASVKASARRGKLKAFLFGVGVGAGVTAGLVLHAVL